jgi:hypothetical protein
MTSEKLENNVKKLKSKASLEPNSKASLFDHCCITVTSMSHHCLITVFAKLSFVTSRCIITLHMHCRTIKWINEFSKPCKWLQIHCIRLEYDRWHLKAWTWHKGAQMEGITVPSLSHHCLITVWSLILAVGLVCIHQINYHTSNTLQKEKIQWMTSQKLANDMKELKSKGCTVRLLTNQITVWSLFFV